MLNVHKYRKMLFSVKSSTMHSPKITEEEERMDIFEHFAKERIQKDRQRRETMVKTEVHLVFYF